MSGLIISSVRFLLVGVDGFAFALTLNKAMRLNHDQAEDKEKISNEASH